MKLGPETVAIICGGASGLGAAVATMLRKHGCAVTILDINLALGMATANSIGALFLATDIADEASIDRSLAMSRDHNGVESVLVNCAGIGPASRVVARSEKQGLAAHSTSLFAKVVNVNLVGAFSISAKCAAAMATNSITEKSECRGVIINTASIAAIEGQVGQAAYSASKAGIVGMTLPMARELGRYGIRVMAVLPGAFDTPLLETVSDDYRARLAASVPFPARLGRPEEYAEFICSVISNDMLNGEAVRIDGALRMAAV